MFRPDYLDMFQEIDLVTSNLKLQTFNFQKKLLYCRTPINNKLIPINRQWRQQNLEIVPSRFKNQLIHNSMCNNCRNKDQCAKYSKWVDISSSSSSNSIDSFKAYKRISFHNSSNSNNFLNKIIYSQKTSGFQTNIIRNHNLP